MYCTATTIPINRVVDVISILKGTTTIQNLLVMFCVDQNGKKFVAARIIMSWRRREGEETGRKE